MFSTLELFPPSDSFTFIRFSLAEPKHAQHSHSSTEFRPPSVRSTSFPWNMAVGVSRAVSALVFQMEANRHPSGDGDGDKRNRQVPADAACSFSSGCGETGEKSGAERRRRRRLPEPRVYIPRVWNYLAASASRLFFPPLHSPLTDNYPLKSAQTSGGSQLNSVAFGHRTVCIDGSF